MSVEFSQNRQAPLIENYIRRLLEQSFARGETPSKLPDQKVADLTDIQKSAIADAEGIGSFLPYFTEAGDMIRDSATPMTAENLQPFMDPYQQQVTQAALCEMDKQGALARNQLAARQVGQGAFGGTRGALQESELARNLQDIKSQRIFQDQSRNYGQAVKAFQDQQARQQGAGSLMAGIGQTGQGTLMGIGALGQNQQQAQLNADFQNRMAQIYDPYRRLGFMRDTLYGAPSMGGTMTSGITPSASPMSQGLGLGISGLGAYSSFFGQS